MSFYHLYAAFGIFSAAIVSAQANLPACALSDFTAAIQGSGCSETNITCICSNPSIIVSMASAVKNNCSPSDQAAASSAADAICTNGIATATRITATATSITGTSTIPMTTSTKTMSGLLLTDTVTANGTMTATANFSGTIAATPSGTPKSNAEAGPDFGRFRLLSALAAIGAMALLFAKF